MTLKDNNTKYYAGLDIKYAFLFATHTLSSNDSCVIAMRV